MIASALQDASSSSTSRPGAPVPAGGGKDSLDLLRIVRINEQIKAVVAVAFKINIMALNAIFLAKRAGSAALGFGVLSNELRVFSRDLRTQMESLRQLIHGSVIEVSRLLQHSRYSRLLEAGARLAGGNARLAEVLARRDKEAAVRLERLAKLRRELKLALEDAFQLVELGGVLAKSAKIEAAYGQSFAASLAQVSGEFDGIVEEIRVSLETLKKSNFFGGKQ